MIYNSLRICYFDVYSLSLLISQKVVFNIINVRREPMKFIDGREVYPRLYFVPQQVLWPPLEIGPDLSKMVSSYLLTYCPPRKAPLV